MEHKPKNIQSETAPKKYKCTKCYSVMPDNYDNSRCIFPSCSGVYSLQQIKVWQMNDLYKARDMLSSLVDRDDNEEFADCIESIIIDIHKVINKYQ